MAKRRSIGSWGIPASWWGKTALMGLAAGILMMGYELLSSLAMGTGPLEPLNLIGASVPAFRPPVATFSPGPTLSGAGIHLATSMLWGLVYGLAAARLAPSEARRLPTATLLGMGLGLLAWIVSGMLIGPWIDPNMRMANPVVYAMGHLIFGVVTALGLALWTRDSELRFLSVCFAPNQLESMTENRYEPHD